MDNVFEALASNATFVARSFAGDSKQVKELIKAALSHDGLAILDIISPCVTFNNHYDSRHSYSWGKEHEEPLHDFTYVPIEEEIILKEEFPEGTTRQVELHDGSTMVLKKLDRDYDPTDRWQAMKVVEEANREEVLLTGLIYVDTGRPSLPDLFNLPRDRALNRMKEEDLRPPKATIHEVNQMMF